MNHMMIDVEALRLKQPWWAPLMSVGMVVFNEQGTVLAQDELFVIPGSLPTWAEAEKSTIEFWESQPYWPELQKQLLTRGEPILDVLQGIATFHKVWNVEAVWFAGPTYDQIMLEYYFDGFTVDIPWRYNDTRDFRTIRKQHPDIYEPINASREGTYHCALDDALHQVRVLREIQEVMKYQDGWK